MTNRGLENPQELNSADSAFKTNVVWTTTRSAGSTLKHVLHICTPSTPPSTLFLIQPNQDLWLRFDVHLTKSDYVLILAHYGLLLHLTLCNRSCHGNRSWKANRFHGFSTTWSPITHRLLLCNLLTLHLSCSVRETKAVGVFQLHGDAYCICARPCVITARRAFVCEPDSARNDPRSATAVS